MSVAIFWTDLVNYVHERIPYFHPRYQISLIPSNSSYNRDDTAFKILDYDYSAAYLEEDWYERS